MCFEHILYSTDGGGCRLAGVCVFQQKKHGLLQRALRGGSTAFCTCCFHSRFPAHPEKVTSIEQFMTKKRRNFSCEQFCHQIIRERSAVKPSFFRIQNTNTNCVQSRHTGTTDVCAPTIQQNLETFRTLLTFSA